MCSRLLQSVGAAIAIAALVFTFQPTADARDETVYLAPGSTVAFATPPFLVPGKRYAFTWPAGGPPQTFTIKSVRPDGWVLVEVADDNTNTRLVASTEFPVRWLHVGLALSIQEMRPLP